MFPTYKFIYSIARFFIDAQSTSINITFIKLYYQNYIRFFCKMSNCLFE